MLVIDPGAFAHAVERLMIAVRSCTDEKGLKVFADTPRRAPHAVPGTANSDANPIVDCTDWPRIQAITLGALVALANGPVRIGGYVEIGGYLAPPPE
jgi:hypothetical protein